VKPNDTAEEFKKYFCPVFAAEDETNIPDTVTATNLLDDLVIDQ